MTSDHRCPYVRGDTTQWCSLAERDTARLREIETAARKVCDRYDRADRDELPPTLRGFIEHLADVLGEGERTSDG